MKYSIPMMITLLNFTQASQANPCIGDRAEYTGSRTSGNTTTQVRAHVEISNITSTKIETSSILEDVINNADGSVTVLTTNTNVQSENIDEGMNEITSARMVTSGCQSRPGLNVRPGSSIIQGVSIPTCIISFGEGTSAGTMTLGGVPMGFIGAVNMPMGDSDEIGTMTMISYSRGTGACVP